MNPILEEGSRAGHTTVTRHGLVVRQSEKALLFFDDAAVVEVWLPKKQIIDWCFLDSGTKDGFRLDHLERNDEIEIVITKWIARREGLIQ